LLHFVRLVVVVVVFGRIRSHRSEPNEILFQARATLSACQTPPVMCNRPEVQRWPSLLSDGASPARAGHTNSRKRHNDDHASRPKVARTSKLWHSNRAVYDCNSVVALFVPLLVAAVFHLLSLPGVQAKGGAVIGGSAGGGQGTVMQILNFFLSFITLPAILSISCDAPGRLKQPQTCDSLDSIHQNSIDAHDNFNYG
jgi:hypothetical protein